MKKEIISIADIRRILDSRKPQRLSAGAGKHAAVALILQETESGPEILFIERARYDADPWSGDIGFPGGKIEAGEVEARLAAARETLEEIGLNLRDADFLGQLDDIAGAHLPVIVSCFVYVTDHSGPYTMSDEIADVFWVPLHLLSDPLRHLTTTVHFRGEQFLRPAIDLRGPGKAVLWGLTYRLVCQFLKIIGFDPDKYERGLEP